MTPLIALLGGAVVTGGGVAIGGAVESVTAGIRVVAVSEGGTETLPPA